MRGSFSARLGSSVAFPDIQVNEAEVFIRYVSCPGHPELCRHANLGRVLRRNHGDKPPAIECLCCEVSHGGRCLCGQTIAAISECYQPGEFDFGTPSNV